jgi:hypothetical protein
LMQLLFINLIIILQTHAVTNITESALAKSEQPSVAM